MDGLQMVMKAIGINPDDVDAAKKAIPEFAAKIDAKVQALDDKLAAIEEKLDTIVAWQNHMSSPAIPAPVTKVD